MDVSSETNLYKKSACDYKSFAPSPRLTNGSSHSDFSCDLNKNHDLTHLSKQVCLEKLSFGSPHLYDKCLSSLKETDKDSSSQDILVPLSAVCITFAIGVAIALVLHIYLGDKLVFVKGVLVSDDERCTALGQKVLHDRGSSVDAAIAAALCLGVVHPHVSGIGGGGVMMVHDIHKNETKVINFQGTVPETLTEEMLGNVSELKAGLQVGVPSMLRGLHQAHTLYGSLSWEDVVTRIAAVAREGISVSFSLAKAISKVKGEQLSQLFKEVFLPDGQALHSGSFLRMPGIAELLDAGLSNFYYGNFSQELVNVVQKNGGVLSRKDISNYRAELEHPVEGLYNDFIIQVPPPPSAGAALILAMNLLKSVRLSENNNNTKNQTYHRITEALKAVLALGHGLEDPKYNSSVTELLSTMLSKSFADVLQRRINFTQGSPPERSYSTIQSDHTAFQAAQVVVMGPDDLIVSVTSSLSRLFGSRLITPSGVILNSLMLDFSWPHKATEPQTNQRNRIQPGKRPLTSLIPIIVLPAWHKCGIYMALSTSGGLQHFREITQVLIAALSYDNDTFQQPQPYRLLGDQNRGQVLHGKSNVFEKVKTNSDVQGILRNKDIIKAMAILPFSAGLL